MKSAKANKTASKPKRQPPRPGKTGAQLSQPPPPAPPPKAQPPEVELPAVLFEGDRPGIPASGPGERFVLGPAASRAQFSEPGELPEAYGTQQVLVTARDPHWLYVHWDLTRDQLRHYNALSRDKHLVLRVLKSGAAVEHTTEVHVHPESRHWFVHVPEAGGSYAVELGYYGKAGRWTRISNSAQTRTPPAVVSNDTRAKFTTVPADVALARLLQVVRTGAGSDLSLAHALEELRLAGHPDLPSGPEATASKPWTPEQERALAEVIRVKQLGRVAVGSLDITELVRQGLQENFSSILAALAGPGGPSSLASPHGGLPAGPGEFWFNVNAELIVYGATEPNASLTIGGRPVTLRPDGSFSHRFALPDGQYELPITAVSADGTEARHAELKFRRATNYVGDVGQHPQDPALKAPPSQGG